MKKLILFFGLFLVLSAFQLSALEIKEGRIKIILNETNGRFSAYYLDDISKEKYLSFFLEDDPRTTMLTVLVGNNVEYMGDSFGYRQTASKTADGAQFEWKSSRITVTESFTFIKSENSSLTDGFKVSIKVQNDSEEELSIGICYLFDTYLGEADQHFIIDSKTVLNNETEYTSNMPEYLVSPSTGSDSEGLQLMLKSEGLTLPDKVLFANWKRLNDNLWNYNSNSTRNFNLLPYSINDSAVALYFEEKTISKGDNREVIMGFGSFSINGFKGTQSNNTTVSSIFDQTVSTAIEDGDLETAVKSDLIAIKDLITQIDKIISGNLEATEEELNLFAQIIKNLESKKSLYED